MFTILVASFVVVCTLTVMAAALATIRRERIQAKADEIILAAEPLRPEWIYGRRMDVPRKRPLLHTRSTKVLR